MAKIAIVTVLTFVSLSGVMGQHAQVDRTYTLGDTVPDLPLGTYLMNFPDRQASLHDLRGKYVMLDFWETYCQPCINALPKLQSLQDKYADQLQIIAVTKDIEQNVRALLGRSEITKHQNIRIPFAIGDTVLQKAFPHAYIPHVVIVNPAGRVEGITHGAAITEERIAAMLSGDKIEWELKEDGIASFQQTDEQLANGAEETVDSSLLWSSYLKRGGSALSRIKRHDDGSIRSLHMECTPLHLFVRVFNLFNVTNTLLGNANHQRIIVDIADTLTYRLYADENNYSYGPIKFPYLDYPSHAAYWKENAYTYHAEFGPGVPDDQVRERILTDLNKALPIKGEIVKRERLCYVLRVRENARMLLDANVNELEPLSQGLPFDGYHIQINGKPIGELLKVLAMFISAPPIEDGTNIDFNVSMQLDFTDSPKRDPKSGYLINNELDMDVLRTELAKYGLYLEPEIRLVDMLLIHD
ncbi:hypothetical protein GCM10007415_25210 [Parapedobacter pyrenivorans]|uniref:Thioredoxin domain-containing protein n=1 Tax=Parapedobacter pyrenivorans TaxID=1305674 RepID=A0A917HUS4_9SPHI|nr:TlpA disulfide reductase family protein [Parapedobacter pyrenivorans]GGG89865.1 hypothetical protein GCM10007415_25210 [Parapedobacter pyrenivorans]